MSARTDQASVRRSSNTVTSIDTDASGLANITIPGLRTVADIEKVTATVISGDGITANINQLNPNGNNNEKNVVEVHLSESAGSSGNHQDADTAGGDNVDVAVTAPGY